MLAILASLSGLVGAGLVMLTLGFPVVTYTNHVQSAIDSGDVYAGLVKAVVFGGLVGGIGCLRGLQTQTGASAVGISTTRAVVSGIVLIIIAEGIFAVLYHYLGI
jgi:phospholipid/cholesterol/gamma-HCH transport system permease protein